MTVQAPPPLHPFGLRLHHDGRWSHEGGAILNRKLREHFDRSVVYLPDEDKYVVCLGHFRGEIEVEEAGFFVRDLDLERAEIGLSDGSQARLDVATLIVSPLDGAILCRVKEDLAEGGLMARFGHAVQAELFEAVLEGEDGQPMVELAGRTLRLPDL